MESDRKPWGIYDLRLQLEYNDENLAKPLGIPHPWSYLNARSIHHPDSSICALLLNQTSEVNVRNMFQMKCKTFDDVCTLVFQLMCSPCKIPLRYLPSHNNLVSAVAWFEQFAEEKERVLTSNVDVVRTNADVVRKNIDVLHTRKKKSLRRSKKTVTLTAWQLALIFFTPNTWFQKLDSALWPYRMSPVSPEMLHHIHMAILYTNLKPRKRKSAAASLLMTLHLKNFIDEYDPSVLWLSPRLHKISQLSYACLIDPLKYFLTRRISLTSINLIRQCVKAQMICAHYVDMHQPDKMSQHIYKYSLDTWLKCSQYNIGDIKRKICKWLVKYAERSKHRGGHKMALRDFLLSWRSSISSFRDMSLFQILSEYPIIWKLGVYMNLTPLQMMGLSHPVEQSVFAESELYLNTSSKSERMDVDNTGEDEWDNIEKSQTRTMKATYQQIQPTPASVTPASVPATQARSEWMEKKKMAVAYFPGMYYDTQSVQIRPFDQGRMGTCVLMSFMNMMLHSKKSQHLLVQDRFVNQDSFNGFLRLIHLQEPYVENRAIIATRWISAVLQSTPALRNATHELFPNMKPLQLPWLNDASIETMQDYDAFRAKVKPSKPQSYLYTLISSNLGWHPQCVCFTLDTDTPRDKLSSLLLQQLMIDSQQRKWNPEYVHARLSERSLPFPCVTFFSGSEHFGKEQLPYQWNSQMVVRIQMPPNTLIFTYKLVGGTMSVHRQHEVHEKDSNHQVALIRLEDKPKGSKEYIVNSWGDKWYPYEWSTSVTPWSGVLKNKQKEYNYVSSCPFYALTEVTCNGISIPI